MGQRPRIPCTHSRDGGLKKLRVKGQEGVGIVGSSDAIHSNLPYLRRYRRGLGSPVPTHSPLKFCFVCRLETHGAMNLFIPALISLCIRPRRHASGLMEPWSPSRFEGSCPSQGLLRHRKSLGVGSPIQMQLGLIDRPDELFRIDSFLKEIFSRWVQF